MGWFGETLDSIKSMLSPKPSFSVRIYIHMLDCDVGIDYLERVDMYAGSESPVVVVLSESMDPGFARGDILFLRMSEDPIRAGEIVVFNVDVHEQKDTGEVYVLTKGDNNDDDDRSLYARGQRWLHRRHILGRAVGFLPYVGWVLGDNYHDRKAYNQVHSRRGAGIAGHNLQGLGMQSQRHCQIQVYFLKQGTRGGRERERERERPVGLEL